MDKSKQKKKLPDKCEICLGPFVDPKLLPCFHLTCRDCVKKLYVKDREELVCPINMCRKPFTCDGKNPELLPDALSIYHKKDLQKFKSKVENRDVFCDLCCERNGGEKPADASCDQCKYICKDCRKRHKTEVKYSDHIVVSFLELSNQDGDDLHYEVLKRSRTMSFDQQSYRKGCKVHPGQETKSYCLDCKQLVCPCCIDNAHVKHHYKAFDVAAKEYKDRIKENLPSVNSVTEKLIDSIHLVKRNEVSIKDQEDALSIAIDEAFERMKRMLQSRQKELHDKLKALTKSKLVKLDKQKREMENLVEEMERMVTFTEESLRTSTEYEILTSFQFLESRVKENSSCVSDMTLDPVEVPNTAFKLSERKELTELCRRLEIYSNEADVTKCTVEGQGAKSAETMCYSNFVVIVPSKNSQPCSTIQDVIVRIKCCKNDSEFSAQVRHKGMGHYHVLFSPEFRGKHNMFVDVNGKSIIGSPFTLNVHASVFHLGFPDQPCIDNVNNPRGITLTPEGKLLICQWNGSNIIEMDSYGLLRKEVDTKHMQLASIALHSSGHLFIVVGTQGKCGLLKCKQDGSIIKSVLQKEGGEQHQFKSPRGIAISPQNKLFICDKDNHRIQIYDTDLRFIDSINLDCLGQKRFQKRPQPNDVAFDRTGNMFITDYSNRCVHVYSPTAIYCFSFSQSKKGNLGRPECICINNHGYIYVSESDKHCISVFRTSGEWVTTFGREGNGEGELKFPTGLAVDEYGTVFVCDLYNNRIQVF